MGVFLTECFRLKICTQFISIIICNTFTNAAKETYVPERRGGASSIAGFPGSSAGLQLSDTDRNKLENILRKIESTKGSIRNVLHLIGIFEFSLTFYSSLSAIVVILFRVFPLLYCKFKSCVNSKASFSSKIKMMTSLLSVNPLNYNVDKQCFGLR